MKTRHDFVSNSSSCSFIIEEPSKFAKFVADELGGNSFYYDFDCLSLIATVDESDKSLLESLINECNSVFTYDGESTATICLSRLIDMSNDDISKFKRLELECYDYATDNVVKLSLLKRALTNCGIKVTNNSEHDLLFEDNDDPSTLSKIYRLAFTQ